ncbi:MAG: hypothetical protein AAGG65_13970 [Pseudomonadota bacterium]
MQPFESPRRARSIGRWRAIMLALAILCVGISGQRASAQDDSFLAFVETYYRNPQPDAALQWMERIAPTMMDEVLIAADPQGQRFALVAGFYAHVLRSQPSLIDPLTERLIAAEQPNLTALGALGIASTGLDAAAPALERLRRTGALPDQTAAALAETPAYPYPTMRVTGSIDVELMWMSFFATGNPLYVRRVADAMGYADYGDAGAAVAAFAYASLADRVTEHPTVRETLRTIAAERTDIVGQSAAELVGSG